MSSRWAWLLIGMAVHATAAAQSLTAEQRLERLERRVDKITELTLQVDSLRRENRELRGQIELQQHQLESLERKQRDLYLDIDQRLSQLQSAPAAEATTPAARVEAPAPEASSRPAADPKREEAEYEAAYDLLRPEQRRYAEAIEAFRAFLAKYPDGKLADNAQYWLAEASYVTQDNDTALIEFQRLVERFPESPKVPGALLKIGYIQHAAGDLEAAQATLSRVARDYPGTPAADMATQRLQRIKREVR